PAHCGFLSCESRPRCIVSRAASCVARRPASDTRRFGTMADHGVGPPSSGSRCARTVHLPGGGGAVVNARGAPRRWLRNIIEANAPALASAVRVLRDEFQSWNTEPRSTPFGFALIGDRSMQSGSFEPEETKLIRSLLTNSDRVIDIGAHV